MKRLASPLSALRAEYDVVVVGSGYGGGVSASRLARAGRSVCVLERGREWHPGDFPATEHDALGEIQARTPDEHVGRATGLYEFHFDEDLNVFKGCGLGGTSLVNANVSLEADPRVFEDPRWPASLADDRDGRLRAGYERARAMLRPQPYPHDQPKPPKLDALERSAEALGEPVYRPPINVTFEDGINHVGVEQHACTLCGDCVTGCNDGAKNTVAMNYLPDAWSHGAELFCEVRVSRVSREGNRWVVHYEPVDGGRDAHPDTPELFVRADVVVLAAGTLGSTEILLRSKAEGLPVSDRLGRSFTGNGDVLAFGYNDEQPIRGVGMGDRDPAEAQPVGPTITGIIDARDTEETQQGMVFEEGAVPGPIASTTPTTLAASAGVWGKETDQGVGDFLREAWRSLVSIVMGPRHGAVARTQTYLAMAHDDGGGELHLDEEADRVRIRWPGVPEQGVFQRIHDRLRRATDALGGTFVPNPMWSNRMNRKLVTVHPLGGCAMGEDASEGVVDHACRVFAGSSGTEVHEGLYVADGAVMPSPLGVNPLLTITAVAERAMAQLCEERGWPFDAELPSRAARSPRDELLGIRFTETMEGPFSTERTDDVRAAAEAGEAAGSTLRFVATLSARELDATLDDPGHPMRIHGTVEAQALSDEPLTIDDGRFRLLTEDPERVETRHMHYRMPLVAQDGTRYLLVGRKDVHDDAGLDLWPDTTTLYTTVHRGDTEDGEIVGRGILRLGPADLARQLTTLEVVGAQSPAERLRARARFGRFFAGSLLDVYGDVVDRANELAPDAPPRERRPLRVGTPEVHDLRTSDGVVLRLTRYHGGDAGPVMLVHGLGVSSRIFATDLTEPNLLETLVGEGYDVWLLDNRTSIELAAARTRSDADAVATVDYPEAVARVRRETGAEDVQMVVHCYGATTFFMAMLAGLAGVRSVVASQIATHAVTPTTVSLKSGLHVPSLLEQLGVERLTAYTDADDPWWEKLYNRALSLQPLQQEERCDNPVCHRVTFLYALLYEHDQLDRRLHDHLHELFGVAHVGHFQHLAEIVRQGTVVDAAGRDVYMGHPERLAVPIRFLHGAENACYLPESTERTLDWLRSHNDPELYDRVEIPDYGHIDCIFGKNAAEDVYPHILEHLERQSGA